MGGNRHCWAPLRRNIVGIVPVHRREVGLRCGESDPAFRLSPGDLARIVKAILHSTYALADDARTFSSRVIWFGVRGLAFNFPGGLYGILGLFFVLSKYWLYP